jgi:hypothetical protein
MASQWDLNCAGYDVVESVAGAVVVVDVVVVLVAVLYLGL